MYGRGIRLSKIKSNRMRLTLRLDKEAYKKILKISERIKTTPAKAIEVIVDDFISNLDE